MADHAYSHGLLAVRIRLLHGHVAFRVGCLLVGQSVEVRAELRVIHGLAARDQLSDLRGTQRTRWRFWAARLPATTTAASTARAKERTKVVFMANLTGVHDTEEPGDRIAACTTASGSSGDL